MQRSILSLIVYTVIVVMITFGLSHRTAQVCAQATGTGSNPGCDPKVNNVNVTRVASSPTSGTFQISWQAQTSSPCLKIQEFKVELKRIKSGTLLSEKTVAGNLTSTSIPDPTGNNIINEVFVVVTAKAGPATTTFSGSSSSTN